MDLRAAQMFTRGLSNWQVIQCYPAALNERISPERVTLLTGPHPSRAPTGGAAYNLGRTHLPYSGSRVVVPREHTAEWHFP